MDRKFILSTTKNTRTTLPNSLRYVRSELPFELSEEDKQKLLDNNIRTAIDLRSIEEARALPCCLAKDERFHFINIPVTGGNQIPPTPDDVAFYYSHMVDSTMDKIIKTIEECETGVLYFCYAGKDRTGIVSALLQRRAGLDREYIMDDYVQSAVNLKEELQIYAQKNPQVNIEALTPQRRYMEEFLDFIEEKSCID